MGSSIASDGGAGKRTGGGGGGVKLRTTSGARSCPLVDDAGEPFLPLVEPFVRSAGFLPFFEPLP